MSNGCTFYCYFCSKEIDALFFYDSFYYICRDNVAYEPMHGVNIISLYAKTRFYKFYCEKCFEHISNNLHKRLILGMDLLKKCSYCCKKLPKQHLILSHKTYIGNKYFRFCKGCEKKIFGNNIYNK